MQGAPMNAKTLGHYRVGEQLGRGGMGEVYVADDLNLNRKVALKFVPDAFTGDRERMARFEREAKVLASLNHPNIAAIYGLEEAEGKRFIVMELVEGETLAQRLGKGSLPVNEALGICRQIAEGLEAAHEKGVVHRDLKPANVMITEGDKVKILDFGLAKALSGETQPVEASQSPTLTEAMTRPGIILGTAAYMSPEQAKGRSVDKRADIWAWGCILYECLTGKKVFEGETVTETLAAILRGEPDWEALPETTPAAIRTLLRRCLERDMSRRFHHADDLRILIEEAGSSFFPLAAPVTRPAWKAVALVLSGLMLAAAIALAALWKFRPTVPAKVTRFSYVLPENQYFIRTGRRLLAISPDGTTFVYEANGQLYLRRLSETEARPITGTQGGAGSPFFSPDGQWVGFYSWQDSTLKKVAVTGGAAFTLCKASNPFGASWQDNTIIFGQGSNGIFAVPATGGLPEVWVKLEPGEVADSPQILPGGDAVLFAVARSTATAGVPVTSGWDKADVVVYSRKTGKRKVLVPGGSAPLYVSTRHIVYALGKTLLMVPFDLGRLETTGSPNPILEGVMRASVGTTGAADFDFSMDGTLVYIPSSSGSIDTDRRVLALVDRTGKAEVLGIPPGPFEFPRLSPNGTQLAVVTSDDGGTIWIYDMSGKGALRRVTFEGLSSFPVWSPDGKRLAFYSIRENKPGIFLQAVNGTGAAQRLAGIPPADDYIPNSWSPDGKNLAFTVNKAGDYGIWTVPLTSEQKAQVFTDLPISTQAHAAFSPDGRFIAYMSGESGGQVSSMFNIYVQSFPKIGAAKYQISGEGGLNDAPVWSRNGKELFYWNSTSQRLMAVPIQTEPSFSFGQPVPLPIEGMIQSMGGRRYDVMPDGRRFLVMLPENQTQEQRRRVLQINVILNFFEELRTKREKQ